MSNGYNKTIEQWTDTATKLLLGRKIVKVRYLSRDEVEYLGWDSSAVVIQLDNDTLIWPSRDDEGNDAGALFTSDPDVMVLPVI